jgi:hypothetical protein
MGDDMRAEVKGLMAKMHVRDAARRGALRTLAEAGGVRTKKPKPEPPAPKPSSTAQRQPVSDIVLGEPQHRRSW